MSDEGGTTIGLPAEVLSVIHSTALRQPETEDLNEIVSEVLQTLAGRQPDLVITAIRASGGPPAFVRRLLEEVRRIRTPQHAA